MKKGLWICVTGLDGTGKTTLKRNLVGHFKMQNLQVKDFKFPYDKHLLDLLNNTVGDGMPWQDNYSDVLVSQRGYIDSFVHGECRGFSYEESDKLMRTYELERCDVMIHLNADPQVAFERIKDDPDADKFETIEYVKKQAEATKRAYEELKRENPALSAFKGIPNVYIDTTNLTTDETFQIALGELKKLAII